MCRAYVLMAFPNLLLQLCHCCILALSHCQIFWALLLYSHLKLQSSKLERTFIWVGEVCVLNPPEEQRVRDAGQVLILSLLQNSWLVPPSPSPQQSSFQGVKTFQSLLFKLEKKKFWKPFCPLVCFDVMCRNSSNRPLMLAFLLAFAQGWRQQQKFKANSVDGGEVEGQASKAEKGSVLWHASLFQ